ncbi:hypothetical protein B0H14DRAFT_2768096 [Mycena olivaceomarginata]|nr:hypothetical protein B0H14DRAFT_2768096 [Mycena olivaceomarginata]
MGTTYDLILGCLLVASWVNMVLFTVELNQIFMYFTRYKREPTFNKVVVVVALSGDLLTVVSSLTTVYLYMVTHWGETEYLSTQPWSIPGYIVGTGITGAAVQIFLVRMLYALTKRWFWLPILGLFIMTGVVGAGITVGSLFLDSSIHARDALVKWVTVWLAGSIAADISITAIFVIKLRTLKTDFRGTSSLIRRLSLASVRNGSITAAMTIATLIVFKLQPETNTALLIEMTIGRVYSLCMLVNLNSRGWILPEGPENYVGPSAKSAPTPRMTLADVTPTVVTVQQEVTIQMDPLTYGRRKPGDAESDYERSEV